MESDIRSDCWMLLNRPMPSEVVGLIFLSIVLAVAVLMAIHGRASNPAPARIIPLGLLALALQTLHFTEELMTGFHLRFPALLRLDEWSPAFFVSFNLAWIALWVMALGALGRGSRGLPAMIVLWFLGLAAIVNGVVHPLLSLATASYFPGTASAFPLGAAGVLLIRRLAGATKPT